MEIEQVQQSGGGIVRPRGGFFLGKQGDVRQKTEQDVGHRCLGAFRFLFHQLADRGNRRGHPLGRKTVEDDRPFAGDVL